MSDIARSKLITVTEGNLNLKGQTIPYIIKRSTRARYTRLEMRRETGLVVVIPRSYHIDRLRDLLQEKQDWILRKFSIYGKRQRLSANNEIKSGDFIPYLGRKLKVLTAENTGEYDRVTLEWDRVIVSTSGKKQPGMILEQWYRIQAAELIKEKLAKWSSRLQVSYHKVTIRKQRTRWGSCSRHGNLSFNWQLLMAPEPVIDYVIVHELAHLKEMNHSKRFWQLVAEHCPRWRAHKKWLRETQPRFPVMADHLSA